MRYQERTVRLYVSPGDTVWLRFSGLNPMETLTFIGNSNASAQNRYLHQSLLQFNDWVNEAPIKELIEKKTPEEYHKTLDDVYRRKKEFFDNYSAVEKEYFSPEFLDFANADIEYWWAYNLMRYYDVYGLESPDPNHKLRESYFDFFLEIDLISSKSLNNEHYLNFLDLYVRYERDKRAATLGVQKVKEVVEEKNLQVTYLKGKDRTLRMIESPEITGPPPVGYLQRFEKARYLNLTTSERYKYYDADSVYDCTFHKVLMPNTNREAWLPSALVNFELESEVQKIRRRRLCFDESSLICGFNLILTEKVLQYVVAKNIIYDFLQDDVEYAQSRVNFFSNNNPHLEFTDDVKLTFKNVKEDKASGILRLRVPQAIEFLPYKDFNNRYVLQKINETKLVFNHANQPVMAGNEPPKPQNNTPASSNNQNTTSPQKGEFGSVGGEIKTRTEEEAKAIALQQENARLARLKEEADRQAQLKEETARKEFLAKEEATRKEEEAKKELLAKEEAARQAKLKEEEEVKKALLAKEEAARQAKLKEEEEAKNTLLAKSEVEKARLAKEEEEARRLRIIEEGIKRGDKMKPEGSTELVPVKPNFPRVDVGQVIQIPADYKTETTVGGVRIKGTAEISKEEVFQLEEWILRENPNKTEISYLGPPVGTTASVVSWVDINGNPVNLADLATKTVVLDFWASWCTSCLSEMENHQRSLLEKYKDNPNVVVIYVNRDKDEATWRATVQRKGFTKGVHVYDVGRIAGNSYYHCPLLPQKYVTYNGRVFYNSFYKSQFKMEQMIEIILDGMPK
jgi:thiol-disulfide isomerase/thioredoxin